MCPTVSQSVRPRVSITPGSAGFFCGSKVSKMPWKSKKRGGRRLMKKRVWRKRKTVNVNRALQPIPQRYICKMKYCETITTNATGTYQFNLNSIFDPNRSGVGGQPYSHDQLEVLYNRYRVISCGYRIQGVQTATGAPIQVAVIPANEVLLPTTVSEVKESPRAKYVTVSPGAPAVYLSGKVYLPSLMGRTKAQYMADDRYQAAYGTSPSELAVLNIKTQTLSDVDSSFTCNVLLEYTVESFDVKQLGRS